NERRRSGAGRLLHILAGDSHAQVSPLGTLQAGAVALHVKSASREASPEHLTRRGPNHAAGRTGKRAASEKPAACAASATDVTRASSPAARCRRSKGRTAATGRRPTW